MLVAVLAACTVSTEDLAAEVQYHIEEELQNSGIIVKSFTLTHVGGNVYKGILVTKEPFGEFKYRVDVAYDGEMFIWEIVN